MPVIDVAEASCHFQGCVRFIGEVSHTCLEECCPYTQIFVTGFAVCLHGHGTEGIACLGWGGGGSTATLMLKKGMES